MTDANGFYRPEDLPQDIPDPTPLSDDEDDTAKGCYAESESGSSVTYLNSPTVRTRASSSAASYIFPDMRGGRRSPVSMSDYGSGYPGYPRLSMDYTPQRSEYTPSASVFTPQNASDYTPTPSLYTPAGTQTPSPTAGYMPLLPVMAERRYGYGTTPELPQYNSKPSPAKKRSLGECYCLRGLFLTITLIPFLLWKLGVFSTIYYELPPSCPHPPRKAFATKGSYSLLPDTSFTFLENARDITLGGDVQVISNPDPEAENVKVDYVITATSQEAIYISIGDDGVVQLLSKHNPSHPRVCATVHIILKIPHSLATLTLKTHTLPIFLDESVQVSTLDVATLHASIRSDATASDSIQAQAETGSISGTFSLATQLVLDTRAGSIDAIIKPLDIPDPRADLVAKTTTGSIVLAIAPGDVPSRNYTSAITTVSGAIRGEFLFGAVARFAGVAGSISAELLPVKYKEVVGKLRTESKHGATRVTFTKKLEGKKIRGWHGAVTGAIYAVYPEDWEGEIEARAKVGAVDVSGDGVEIEERSWGWVKGFKGNRTAGSLEAIGHVGAVTLRIE